MGGGEPANSGGGRLLRAAVFLLVLQASSGAQDVCRTGCRGASNTFKYTEGTTYKYNYEGKIDISLSTAEQQVTSTEVRAVVLLTQQADCNQVIRLQNVQILGPGGKKYGTIPDVEKPIRINFHDGHLEDSICVEPGDNQNSINIKRAIASMFQANVDHTHETDVFGVCPTDISKHQEGNVLVINKARYLNKCGFREHIQQDFLTTAFNLDSQIRSSPILNADYQAKLRIKSGILESAAVTENYLYVPFSVGKNGAKAEVTSKLTLTGTSKDNPSTKCSEPRSIIFETPHPVIAPTSSVANIINGVKEVAKTIDVVVGENTARQFVNLVRIVRSSKKGDLLAAYNQVKSGAGFPDKEGAKRAFLDALLRAGNGDTLEAAIQLLKTNELDRIEQKLVYLGLSMVRHATESSLNTAAELLNQPGVPREAFLGIGNLAGRYCREHKCENVKAVHQLSQKLLAKLGAGKPANRQEENDMIYVLKAFKNIHHIDDAIVQKLVKIANDKNAPNRLRAVALEAFLADPCKDKLRDTALHILQDTHQDSEIRIRAYLAVAECPNAKIGNAVNALLEKENSYQVGGFIESHIRTLRTSANPDKLAAREHLGFRVKNKFPIDPRKYSYNGELSYSIGTLGLGASSEANVIYSQNSWLPRSSNLNLTAEIFGHNINFLEIQTRQENLDKLVEHYFGPSGVLRKASMREMFKEGARQGSHLWNTIEEKLNAELKRAKRDLSKAEVDKIGKQVQIKTNELNRDLDVDLSIKTFGSEILFLNVNQDVQSLTPEAIIDRVVKEFGRGLDRLKNFEQTLRSNMVFLDAELDYPTSLGFPLRLAAEGAANMQVRTEGHIDVRQLWSSQKDGKLNLKLIPSANIEVTGRLTLDALVVENGLKVVSNLYSAVGGDLNIEWYNQGRGVDVKFGLPVTEQKLISANHEIVFHQREQAGKDHNEPLKFSQSKDFSVCLDQLSPFIGLTFCAEINGPNLAGKEIPVLPFPLSGDAKFAVTIENDDVSEYHFNNEVKGDPPTSGIIAIETIGKNKQKKASILVEGEISPERFIRATFSAPSKSITERAEARLTTSDKEKSISFLLDHSGQKFAGKIGVAVSGSAAKAIYKPLLEYQSPAGPEKLPVHVDGQIIVEQNGPNVKYTFDKVQLKSDAKVINIEGNLGREGEAFFSDLTVGDGAHSASLKGRFQANANLVKFNAEVQNTINPNANFNVKGEFKHEPGQYSSSLQVIHGRDLSSKTNILSISNSVTRRYESPHDFLFSTKNKITYPLLGLATKFEYEHRPKTLEYDLDVQYNDVKFGSELDAKVNTKERGDYDVEFEIWGLNNKVKLDAKRQVQGEESKISNELEVNGKKMEVEGKIRHSIKPQNIDVGADLTVTLPTHPDPFKVSSGLKCTPNELDAHQKITSGSNVIVDAFLKANRAGDANGSVKVNIQNVLAVNGQVTSSKGTGNADLLVDLQSAKRQMKAETQFQVQLGKLYNIEATLYPSFDQDKNKKIVLKTNTKIAETGIESRNSANLLGHNLEANVKGSRTGDIKAGNENGEIEIVLPNEQYFLVRSNCDHKEANDLANGQAQGLVEYRKNRNSPGRKASWKSTWKNTNMQKGIYDIEYNLAADDSNGQNINADIVARKSQQGDTHSMEYRNKMYGSLLKEPIESTVTAQCKKGNGQYEIKANQGAATTLNVKGKYDVVPAKKMEGDITVQLQSPSKVLKTFQMTASGAAAIPESLNDDLNVRGSLTLLADDDGTTPGPIVDVNTQGEMRVNNKAGEVKGTFALGKEDPVSVNIAYERQEQGGTRTLSGSAAVGYGKGKTVTTSVKLNKDASHSYRLDAEVSTPVEGYKNTKLSVTTKRADEGRKIHSNVQLSHEGETWNMETDIANTDTTNVVDLKVTCPKGKLSEIYVRANRVNSRNFGGELKILHEAKQFTFEASGDVSVETIEDFLIKGNINSPNLNINKLYFEIFNKPGKTDRKIQIVVKSANKNLISGSTNYNAREENNKYIVEGSGSFKVKDETQSGNFKYIAQRLTNEKNGEQGVEISFDAGLGNKAIDAEFKATNKHFRILNSYCEEKKECAHVDIESKISSNDIHNYNQVVEVNIDLRKLGLSHEFGLKSVTTRKEWVLDHTVDVHFQSNENSKYQYSLYIHPQRAGVSLTTPKRVIALEGKVQMPKNIREGGKASGEVVFYLDKKNHANKKTAVSGWVDVNAQAINGEAKFIHPGLQRPLEVSVKTNRQGTPTKGDITVETVLDVFAQPNQKIVATYRIHRDLDQPKQRGGAKVSLDIKSAGLAIDVSAGEVTSYDAATKTLNYEGVFSYHVGNTKLNNVLWWRLSPSEAAFLLQVMNVDVLKAMTKMTIERQHQVIDSEISSYDKNPLGSHLEIKNYNTLSYQIGFKNNPQNQLQINAGLIPGQVADLRADRVLGNQKVNLFHATLKLDEANFMKPDYSVNSKAIEDALQSYRQRTTEFLKGLSNVGKEWTNEIRKEGRSLGELAKSAMPNMQQMKQYYVREMKEIKDEILADKTLKEFAELLRKVFGVVFTAVSELIEKLNGVVEQVVQAIQTAFQGVLDTIEKEVYPQVRHIAEKLLKAATEIADTVMDIVLGVLAKLSKIIEQYQPEIKQIATALNEINADVARFIHKAYMSIRDIVMEQSQRLYDEIKALPVVEELKAQYQEFVRGNSEGLINTIREIIGTLKDAIPTELVIQPELNQILDTVGNYVEKKLRGQPVNDLEVFGKLGETIAVAIKKLSKLLTMEELQLPGEFNANMLSVDFLRHLPRLVAAKFSPITFIMSENISMKLLGLGLSFINTPRNLVPPFPMVGMIINGQHLFTFDGRLVTLPGNCNYLLARDAMDGNFTLVGTYKDGVLTAITLADRHDTITYMSNGQTKLNNAATDLPARRPTIAAFRDYEMVHLLSPRAGIRVDCTPDLQGCAVSVSGFYHGQVRGLLGNGNNEPYDDFTLPTGKVAANPNEFGNAYKMGASCPDVAVPAGTYESEETNPACRKMFEDEGLMICAPFVPRANFMTACNRGLKAGIKGVEKMVASAYVAQCWNHGVPAIVPDYLKKCTNSDKPFNVGDTFSVKLPGKAADIVLLIETAKETEQMYKEMLQPVIQEIGKELHSKGINDVEFHIIAYGGENRWPSHITTNGKMTFKGRAPNLKFTEQPKEEKLELPKNMKHVENAYQIIRQIFHDMELVTGLSLPSRTYREGLSYPFRAHALKSLIVLNSKQCEVGRLALLQKLSALLYRDDMISLNLFTPLESLTLVDAKKTKDVAGFSSGNVFSIPQGKKNPKGSSDLYDKLEYDDYCVDFTIKNRGNVFVNDNFLATKAEGRKQFIHVAAHNIVHQLTNVEQGLDCECRDVNPWSARNVCRVAYTKERTKA